MSEGVQLTIAILDERLRAMRAPLVHSDPTLGDEVPDWVVGTGGQGD